mmetsp:Transcript_23882/g.74733  ORF Transcript_23882/g.74733 Transcript_23882/m.74733 type:complete len:313 (+) Transcript_23882:34-972(+)
MFRPWWLVAVTHAWRSSPQSWTRRRPLYVQPITLESGDVEATAAMLGSRVCAWLDEEWIEQECHERIGERVSAAYRSARRDGVTDLGEMVVRMGSALGGDGPTAASEVSDFEEAYVGPWDVANYVSDILVELSSSDWTTQAARLRAEAAALEAELEPRAEASPSQRRYQSVPGSRWRVSCVLGDRRFVLELELARGDRPGDGDDLGDLVVLNDPSNVLERVFAWKAETDPDGSRYVRLGLKPAPGLLDPSDGDTLYLNARIDATSGFIDFADGTLTVKRAQPARFLFVEYPSLIARLTVVGRFTAAPLASRT